jgi:hypothetical protein
VADEGLPLGGGGEFFDEDAHPGMGAAEGADDAWEVYADGAGEEADAELAELARLRTLGDLDGVGGGGEGFAGFDEEEVTVGGQTDLTAGAIEEGDIELGLEVGELLADGGLGDVEGAGGAAYAALFGYGYEIAEVA